jgi:hypothetical protein
MISFNYAKIVFENENVQNNASFFRNTVQIVLFGRSDCILGDIRREFSDFCKTKITL